MTDKGKFLKMKDIDDLDEDMANRILFDYITKSYLTATRYNEYHVDVLYNALDVLANASE